MIAGDHRVSIGQPLNATGVVKKVFTDVLVGDAPHNLPLRVYLDDAISVRAANERVAIRQSNGRERPIALGAATVVSRETAKHFARGRFVFLHRKIQQMWRDIISIGQHPKHPGLHVRVLFLTGQDHRFQDFPCAIDDNRPRLRPQFGHQIFSITQRLHCADFLLLPFIRPHNFLRLAIHLCHPAVGKPFRAIQRE